MKTSENQSFSVLFFFWGGVEWWGAIVIEWVLIVYFSTELHFYSLVHFAFLIRENCDNINRLDASTEEICLKPNTRFLPNKSQLFENIRGRDSYKTEYNMLL